MYLLYSFFTCAKINNRVTGYYLFEVITRLGFVLIRLRRNYRKTARCTPTLPETENVLASFIYINPSSALEYTPKLLGLKTLLLGYILLIEENGEEPPKFIYAGATDTPANAYKLSFSLRFNCKPTGAATTVALPPLKKLKLVEIPLYEVTNHLDLLPSE